MSKDISELNKVPASMQRLHNALSTQQNILQGKIKFIDEEANKEDLLPTLEEEPQPKLQDTILKEEVASQSYNIPDVNAIAPKIADLTFQKLKAYLDLQKKDKPENTYTGSTIEREATLKIDVLSYTFTYTQFQQSNDLYIFILNKPFSLNITEPVKFKLKAYDLISDDFIGVTCLGAPIELPQYKISLLLFLKD